MNRKDSESGYALLIVLLLIVLVISISAVFLRGSISNAKQEKFIDLNHLAVVAAEAGVQYYETELNNTFYEVLPLMKEKYETMITEQEKQIREGDIRDYNFEAINKNLYNILQPALLKKIDKVRKERSLSTKFSFELSSRQDQSPQDIDNTINLAPENNVLVAKGTVKGRHDQIVKTIDFTQKFPLPDFKAVKPPIDEEEKNKNEIEKPIINFDSLYPDSLEKGVGICTVSNNKVEFYGKEINRLEESPKYKGVCKLMQSVHEINNAKVYGIVYLLHNGTKAKDSIMYHDNAAFFSNLSLDNSYLTIKAPINIYGHKEIDKALQLVNNSKLIGNGSLTVNGKTKIEKSNLIYRGNVRIHEDLELDKKSYIYIANSGSKNNPDKLSVDHDFDIEKSNGIIENEVVVGKEFQLEESNLVIESNLTVKDELELDESTLKVLGNLEAKDLDIEDGSKLCVAGDFTITGKIEFDDDDDDDDDEGDDDDMPSYIYLLNEPSTDEFNSLIRQGKIVIKSVESEFNKSCGGSGENPSTKVDWPVPTIDVTYVKR